MRRVLLLFLVLGLAAVEVRAQCNGTVCAVPHAVTSYATPTYNTVHVDPYVEPVLVAQFVPLVVNVPSYTVSYTPYITPPAPATLAATPGYGAPAQVAPAASPCDAKVAELQKQIDDLKAALGPAPVLQPPPGQAAAQPQAAGPAEVKLTALYTHRCAECHEAVTAAKEGKGFVLLAAGKIAPLSGEQWQKVLDRTGAKRNMPPARVQSRLPLLTEAEFKLQLDVLRERGFDVGPAPKS